MNTLLQRIKLIAGCDVCQFGVSQEGKALLITHRRWQAQEATIYRVVPEEVRADVRGWAQKFKEDHERWGRA